MVIHEAPLDKHCKEETNPVAGVGRCELSKIEYPVGWDMSEFDDSGWINAHVYSAKEVRPKDGYDRINWDADAELIWGPDLETNNTLLCRRGIEQ